MDSTVGSSSLPSAPPSAAVTLLAQLVIEEKENMRSWLRTEMNSLVDPLIDTLFRKLTKKLNSTTSSSLLDTASEASVVQNQLWNPSRSTSKLATNFHHPHQRKNVRDIVPKSITSDSHIPPPQSSSSIKESSNQVKSCIILEPVVQIKEELNDNGMISVINELDLTDLQRNHDESNDESNNLLNPIHDEQNEFCFCDDCLSGEMKVEPLDHQEKPVSRPKSKRQRTEPKAQQDQQPQQPVPNEQSVVNTLSVQCFQPECELLFPDKNQLIEHLWSGHTVRRYQCYVKQCYQSFDTNHTLGAHIRAVHSDLIRFPCDLCPQRDYNTYILLSQHTTRSHHLGTFECVFPGCGFKGDCRKKVYDHYETSHRQTFVCEQANCGYRTTNVTHFKEHSRAHLGIEPYRCKWPGCTYSATKQTNALRHIRCVHLKTYPSNGNDTNAPEDPKEYLGVELHLL